MLPTPIPESPVPTSQRPINGAIAGGGALLFDQLARVALVALLPTELAPIVAVASPLIGMVASGVMATVGDVARSQIIERPPVTFVGKLTLGLLARIG